MSRSVAAAGLLVLAGLLHFAYTVPARAEAQALVEEHRRAFEKWQQVRVRREQVERRLAEYARVSSVLASAARGSSDPAGELRGAVLAILRDSDLAQVRVSVVPGREAVGATLQVSGRGRIGDVMRFAGALVQPSAGVVLESVRLSVQPSGIAFDVSGARLRVAR